jgi:hypothetical protein
VTLYLANPSTPSIVDVMLDGRLGYIDTPRQRNAAAGAVLHAGRVPWCADNGCFSDRWDADHWWEWLQSVAVNAETCLFAVAPDVVGDAAATLALSAPWMPRIRALGFPVAFVAQDGLESFDVPFESFDVLFLGGSTSWKLGEHARRIAWDAAERGIPVHVGRVNSERRLLYSSARRPYGLGASTVDGTFLTFGPDTNLPILLSWMPRLTHPPLFV